MQLPIDKSARLLILLRVFRYIQNNSFESFIDRVYGDNYIKAGTDLLLLIAGVVKGLKGDSSLNHKNMERSHNRELKKIEIFNDDITSEFENSILDDLELKYPKHLNKLIMGDNYENINNSTIVNRGFLMGAIDRQHDSDSTQLLINLKNIIENSNDENAIGLFNDFLQELSDKQPKKRRLKCFWKEILELIPKIKDLTDITLGVSNLINMF